MYRFGGGCDADMHMAPKLKNSQSFETVTVDPQATDHLAGEFRPGQVPGALG